MVELNEIKTIAMLKMEKNYRALIEKGYQRQPYKDIKQNMKWWIYRLEQEIIELKESKDIHNFREELADLSNIIDYMFEKTFIIETERDKTINPLFENNSNSIKKLLGLE